MNRQTGGTSSMNATGTIKSEPRMETKITDFFGNFRLLTMTVRETIRNADLYLSSDFNVFDYVSPDEVLLSRIITDLIHPEGKHGQGKLFLNQFLKLIGLTDLIAAAPVTITQEDPTTYINRSGRRIDATIEMGKFAVGVENKPWAADQQTQIRDYAEHLSKKYGRHYLLVYLSSDGNDPSAESISTEDLDRLKEQGLFRTWAYGVEFRGWLTGCYKECQSEKVRWFLRDFIDYVERNFKLS
jgi:PD-(D/E)XK nuclease superfamily